MAKEAEWNIPGHIKGRVIGWWDNNIFIVWPCCEKNYTEHYLVVWFSFDKDALHNFGIYIYIYISNKEGQGKESELDAIIHNYLNLI